MNAIKMENVSLTYNLYSKITIRQKLSLQKSKPKQVVALKNINLEIHNGEVLGIIGPNGSGKSTLLKVISRIIEPDNGRCVIRGRVSPLLGLGNGFNPELDAIRNTYLNGLLLGFKKKELDSKLEQIIEFSELNGFVEQPVKTYSTGMRARLAFSIAAHLEPDILLIDEILGVGDVAFQKKSFAKIKEIIEGQATVLLVSHSIVSLTKLASRVLWLDKGQVRACADKSEVLEQYTEFYQSGGR